MIAKTKVLNVMHNEFAQTFCLARQTGSQNASIVHGFRNETSRIHIYTIGQEGQACESGVNKACNCSSIVHLPSNVKNSYLHNSKGLTQPCRMRVPSQLFTHMHDM